MKAALFFIFLSVSFGWAVRRDDDVIVLPKYNLGATPIYSDEAKQKILSAQVDTGTGTLTDANFVPYVLDDETKSAIQEQWKQRAVKEQALLNSALELHKIGFDVRADTAASVTKINEYKTKHDAFTP